LGVDGRFQSGWLLIVPPFGWSLVLASTLKAMYDPALLRQFSVIKSPEERCCGLWQAFLAILPGGR
jgi:hypothetical protein